jgi:hypothetical protein
VPKSANAACDLVLSTRLLNREEDLPHHSEAAAQGSKDVPGIHERARAWENTRVCKQASEHATE